jgi:hypothetical protein
VKQLAANRGTYIFTTILNLMVALSTNLAAAQQEMKIDRIQPFWPASCDSNFDPNRKYLSFQYARIHAVTGRIKKAEITSQSTVSIEGSYYGSTCERIKGPRPEHESAPKNFIWRPAFLRNNKNIEVYIQSKFETFFKVDLVDDQQFKMEIPLDQFFSSEDLQAVLSGQSPKNNKFHLVFVLLTDEGLVPSGYIPPSYTYTYSLSSDQKTIELRILK